MKVKHNNRRKVFEAERDGKAYTFPYSKCEIQPVSGDLVVKTYLDPEIGNEGFVYVLKSGAEGTILWDWVLSVNKDPDYLRKWALYELTVVAQDKVKAAAISKGEIRRRLGTSAAQLNRLLDQTNYSKSVDQLLRLLAVLECTVEFVVAE